MKKLSIILFLFSLSCSFEEQRFVNSYAKDLVYFKDTRTNYCFAKFDRGLANVPCEGIPEEMLYIADVK